jgi:hypothetical protein
MPRSFAAHGPSLLSHLSIGLALMLSANDLPAADTNPVRPPAIPLIAHDPYFSIWSSTNKLTDSWPRHWTGTVQAMCGIANIDGKGYRYMGPEPRNFPAMEQKSVMVTPTRTAYLFEAGGARITLTFITPALAQDLDVLARPVTYVQWEVASADGAPHDVSVYLDCSGEIAVNRPEQKIAWTRARAGDLQVLRVGTTEQPVLEKHGDDLRIDWGYFYLAAPKSDVPVETAAVSSRLARENFAKSGAFPDSDDLRMPRPANDEWPVLASRLQFGSVAATTRSAHLLVAYDDLYSIEYFQRRLRPYWRRNGMEISELLVTAEKDYGRLAQACADFDRELTADMVATGGDQYAAIATLAYRQCFAAHKLVADFDGTPLFFPKENFSNGCIMTVDVIYPSAPQLLLLNPALLRGQLGPVLDYASSPRWRFPFAPHDLGQYPHANGQVYGGGEKTEENQMPVEESADMLILLAALAKAENTPAFAVRYWDKCTQWANYLREKGMDPENQLCTDDFAGHLAHNTNLSLKAIVGLACYADLAKRAGKQDAAAEYRKVAEQMTSEWIKKAAEGDHFKLTFDATGTWSQKYNLVWDKVLELNLFPADVAAREIVLYKGKLQKYGLPLDSRKTYTKLDWTIWTATLAEKRPDWDALIAPIFDFVNHSPTRVPLTDWYEATDAKMVGFQARSVVGGVFIPLLAHGDLWSKWAGRASRVK